MNVDSDTSTEEIREFLVKYGFPPFDELVPIPGNGSRPSVLLNFKCWNSTVLRHLQPHINGMYWKMRKLRMLVFSERFN